MFETEAEEYGNEYWGCLVDCDDKGMLQEAYKDGAEFGYNKANEWHDLRKNPNDLPNTDRNVWVKRESEIECQIDNYYKDDKGWGIMFREGYCTDDVILWCELPVPPKESE